MSHFSHHCKCLCANSFSILCIVCSWEHCKVVFMDKVATIMLHTDSETIVVNSCCWLYYMSTFLVRIRISIYIFWGPGLSFASTTCINSADQKNTRHFNKGLVSAGCTTKYYLLASSLNAVGTDQSTFSIFKVKTTVSSKMQTFARFCYAAAETSIAFRGPTFYFISATFPFPYSVCPNSVHNNSPPVSLSLCLLVWPEGLLWHPVLGS